MTAKQRQEVERRCDATNRIWTHYAHACEKHPYFCDRITSITAVVADSHLNMYRAALELESTSDFVEVHTVLSCEFYEAIQAHLNGDTAAAVVCPLIAVAAPFGAAVWAWNETED